MVTCCQQTSTPPLRILTVTQSKPPGSLLAGLAGYGPAVGKALHVALVRLQGVQAGGDHMQVRILPGSSHGWGIPSPRYFPRTLLPTMELTRGSLVVKGNLSSRTPQRGSMFVGGRVPGSLPSSSGGLGPLAKSAAPIDPSLKCLGILTSPFLEYRVPTYLFLRRPLRAAVQPKPSHPGKTCTKCLTCCGQNGKPLKSQKIMSEDPTANQLGAPPWGVAPCQSTKVRHCNSLGT